MRILKTLVIALLLIGISFLTIGWVLITDRGPELAQEWLFLATGHRAQVREISFSPARMVLSGVSIGKDLQCSRIEIWTSWKNILQSRPEIDRVVFHAPDLTVHDAREILAKTSFLNAPFVVSQSRKQDGKAGTFISGFIVKEIIVRDGRIKIIFPSAQEQPPYVMDRVRVEMGQAIFPLRGEPLAFRLDAEIQGFFGCLSRVKMTMAGEWRAKQNELRGALVLGNAEEQLARSRLVLNERGLKMDGRIELKHLSLLSEGEGLSPLKTLLLKQATFGAAKVRSDFSYDAPLAHLKGGTLRLKGELVLPGPEKEALAK